MTEVHESWDWIEEREVLQRGPWGKQFSKFSTKPYHNEAIARGCDLCVCACVSL